MSAMAGTYQLSAVLSLLAEGEDKGHLETVTFTAISGGDVHKWWSVNIGTFVSDFSKIVPTEIAKETFSKLRRGETVEFPGRYELDDIYLKFGGAYGD